MATDLGHEFKCRFCSTCNGFGCIGQLPGLGGVYENENFKLNCAAWKTLRTENDSLINLISKIPVSRNQIMCGPVTGAVQNIGCKNESDFYFPYFSACQNSNIGICVGDGFPDEKLLLGIEAIKKCDEKNAAFFLKPYENEILFKRIELVKNFAAFIGVDIDSHNILTMQNLVHLEKKDAASLNQLRHKFNQPFVLKGIFTESDIELVKEVRPDVVFISNHGGRVETRKGSTAEFLKSYGNILKNYCDEIWIDGGIRTKQDVQTALYFGAKKIILARPLIKSLMIGGKDEVEKTVAQLVD